MSKQSSRVRRVFGLALAAGAVMLVALAVPAAAGVGDVFKLGQLNTADATSVLSGTTAGPQLRVVNASIADGALALFGLVNTTTAGAGAAAVRGQNNGSNRNGYGVFGSHAGGGSGVRGESATGPGVSGRGGAYGGYFYSPGSGVGVSAWSAGNDGVQAWTTAANRSALWAHHDGANYGNGVTAFSANGVAVAATGNSTDAVTASTPALNRSAVWAHHDGGNWGYGVSAQSANGVAVNAAATSDDGLRASTAAANRSAVWAHHDGGSYGYGLFAQSATGPAIGIKGPDTGQPPITLNGAPFPSATAGYKDSDNVVPNDNTYHPITSLNVAAGHYVIVAKANVVGEHVENHTTAVTCRLTAGGDYDETQVFSADVDQQEAMSFTLFHTFAAAGPVTLSCLAVSWRGPADILRIKIAAIRVAGGTNTAMP